MNVKPGLILLVLFGLMKGPVLASALQGHEEFMMTEHMMFLVLELPGRDSRGVDVMLTRGRIRGRF